MRKYLQKLRAEKDITQQSVADNLGITRQYYNLIEAGERQQCLKLETARKLADIFGVTLEYILENENKTA